MRLIAVHEVLAAAQRLLLAGKLDCGTASCFSSDPS